MVGNASRMPKAKARIETLMLLVMITPDINGRSDAAIVVQSWWLWTPCTIWAGTSE